jgi:hypothetical protein
MKKISIELGQKVLFGNMIFLAIAIGISPAIADEVWSSDYGSVVYQADRGKTAIWTYGDSARGAIFIEGLAGRFSSRGTYDGYWSQYSSKVRCDTYREGRDGKPTYYWGSFRVKFLESEFPARWSATFGYCDRSANLSWRAYPVVGNGSIEPLKLP